MTVRYQMKLKGLDEYLEHIAQSGQDVDAAAAKAVAAGGDVVLESMLEIVPVGDAAKGDKHPGNLKAHLERSSVQQDGNFISIDVGMSKNTDKDTAIYGNVQEYGSATNAAQPYIRPAFDKNRKRVRHAELKVLKAEGVL